MPLYELYRLAREKLNKGINNTHAADQYQSSSPENDFFELVWENGQVSTQGQSSRARKSPPCRSLPSHCLPSHSPKGRDKDVGGYAVTNSRMGKFGDLDCGLNEIPMSVPSHEVDFSHHGDMMPWLDYTMDGSLQHGYGSDFLNEISGVTENDLPLPNDFAFMDKRSNGNQVFRDSHKNSAEPGTFPKDSSAGEVETARPKASTNHLYPSSSYQCQTSFVSARSRVSDVTENTTSNATQHAPRGEVTQIPSSSSDFSGLKMQKEDPITTGNVSTILNFSHFARPAAVVRANLQNIGLKTDLSSARSDSMGKKSRGAATTSSNPPKSTRVDSRGEGPKEPTMHSQQAVEQSNDDLKMLEPKSVEHNAAACRQLEPGCKESATKIDWTSNQVHGESGSKGQTAAEKSMEPAVASSSVCSGNGADRGLDEPNQNLKRKSQDTEDSEYHSEDAEEESVGVKKAAAGRGGTSSKRSRAAEVHNLSERRRRDRINEKMRALQELIPNCNKVDKASMLDEAIEYLKTLQTQVQMMSMGAGLYMPPMMIPAGMQHIHAPHMVPFSHMSVGMQMGLGMGYGMAMPEMNGASSKFPMIQVPQMQRTHLPVAHISGPTLHGVARSNHQGFGLPAGVAEPAEPVTSASASGSRDPMPTVDPQDKQSTGGCDKTSQMPNQCEVATVGFEQSALVQNNGHAS